MRRKKFQIITLSFVLLLQAIFFQIAMPNLILCFGDDGHIAFEWQTDDDDCTPGNPVIRMMFSKSGQEYRETPELDCTDINLHFHLSSAEKNQSKKHSLTQAKTYVSPKVWISQHHNPFISNKHQYQSSSDQIMEIVQSTVLLI